LGASSLEIAGIPGHWYDAWGRRNRQTGNFLSQAPEVVVSLP